MMKRSFICCSVVASLAVFVPFAQADDLRSAAASIEVYGHIELSREEVDGLIAELAQPARQQNALSKLVRFADFKLFKSGGSEYMSSRPEVNELRAQAVRAIHRVTNLQSINQALHSDDTALQLWGLWFWKHPKFCPPQKDPLLWQETTEQVKHLVVEGEPIVRLHAVERLPYWEGKDAFFAACALMETSPDVLVRLMSRGWNQNLSARFNPYLLRLLNHSSRDVRIAALNFIANRYGRRLNWEIQFDDSVKARAKELENSDSSEEANAAKSALASLEPPDISILW